MSNVEQDELEMLKIDKESVGNADNINEEEEVQYSTAELKAMEDGWRPLDEWEGDPDNWVSAKEFNFRGELMSRISSQSGQLSDAHKKVEDLSKAMKVLSEHHKKTAEVEHKRILESLKRAKAEALNDGDNDTVVEIDEKIQDLKASAKEEAEQFKEEKQDVKDAKAEVPQAVAKWLSDEKNAWYHSDPVRKGVADSVSDAYMRANPDADLIDMLKHVDKVVREELPHKFASEKGSNNTPKVTEAANVRRGGSKKFTRKDLSSDQAEAAQTFVDMGVFPTVQAYVDELVSIGELG